MALEACEILILSCAKFDFFQISQPLEAATKNEFRETTF